MSLSRRSLLTAAVTGGAIAALGGPRAQAAPRVLRAGDPDFAALAGRGYNRRFQARPARIYVPTTTEEVRDAVAAAVSEGSPLAARSGGHCFDDFVDNARTGAIIDLGELDAVYWDDRHRAFSVAAGADLGAVYEALHRWDVTVPAGICLGVGMGGHVCGGGYGPLSRRFGLVADHLAGVEVVTVDDAGGAKVVVAKRDGSDHDLWWAHTGGGGGNVGVVTRFLLRSPDAEGADPAHALPKPPREMLSGRVILPVATEDSFVRFVGNYLAFFEQHSGPGDEFAGLYAPLMIRTTGTAAAELLILLDAETPDARARFDTFVRAVTDGVFPPAVALPVNRLSYPDTVRQVYYAKAPSAVRVKVKSAYLRRAYTPEQLRIFYRYLVDPRFLGESQLEFLPFGGAINAVASGAAAMPARDCFMKMLIHAAWRLPGDDDRYLRWAREMYRDVHADTGGVPTPNETYGGSYINYPDGDLADPAWNTSGIPWHTFYYRDNYPRLRRITAEWDPGNVFAHQLSIGRPDW
ncbi:FAD-binding oxidoreductase [Nocardia neocaledoniensis]|uniref:FAD-binding oxidoreductase n=1 Tax=Nocardia neocaledoniensis TaxID=236511 RepID=UPI002456EC87|nr:FAD-binding protein [Nocardia neocaledoniensis]